MSNEHKDSGKKPQDVKASTGNPKDGAKNNPQASSKEYKKSGASSAAPGPKNPPRSATPGKGSDQRKS
ncbi:MAG: hypothetical protein K8I27_03820 [Planctomycetes bacterium]|nr:hypothetical protein [Planctomycetota bacterium]